MPFNFEDKSMKLSSREAIAGLRIAREIASDSEKPLFHTEKSCLIEESEKYLRSSGYLREFQKYTGDIFNNWGHGFKHSVTVAIEGGAIVLAEIRETGIEANEIRCLEHVQIAGLLHDIRRKEKNHAIAGALEAERILLEHGVRPDDIQIIKTAISNHEAFKKPVVPETVEGKIVSDALYDADKFRWGPDNYLETIWYMLDSMNIPLKRLVMTYPEKVQGIIDIKKTFRSGTGIRYGPDFIDRGLKIGEKLIERLAKYLKENC